MALDGKQRLVLLGCQVGLFRSPLAEDEEASQQIPEFSQPLVIDLGQTGLRVPTGSLPASLCRCHVFFTLPNISYYDILATSPSILALPAHEVAVA